jgi:hypothetical protein
MRRLDWWLESGLATEAAREIALCILVVVGIIIYVAKQDLKQEPKEQQ